MKKQNPTSLLKETILMKELELEANGKLLKSDFHQLYESLRPVNLLKEIASSPGLKKTVVDTSIGIAVGYISKKIIIGASHNPVIKILGSVLQFSISTLVMQNPESIKSVASQMLKRIFLKKELESENTT